MKVFLDFIVCQRDLKVSFLRTKDYAHQYMKLEVSMFNSSIEIFVVAEIQT